MIYKINFSISGDNFFPENIIGKTTGGFIVKSFNNPTDKKFEGKEDTYNFGSALFWHIKKFSTHNFIHEYEKSFVDFLEKNYLLFTINGAKDFVFFIEIYYDGGQCNFEIFNKVLLKKMAKFKVSIPVSIYTLSEKELQEWADEIESEWGTTNIKSE